mgnify:CR=1 FL=1
MNAFDKHWYTRKPYKNVTELSKVIGLNRACEIQETTLSMGLPLAAIDEALRIGQETGARIVHACGFDSIPSDLGVWFTQQAAERRFSEPCRRIAMRVVPAWFWVPSKMMRYCQMATMLVTTPTERSLASSQSPCSMWASRKAQ